MKQLVISISLLLCSLMTWADDSIAAEMPRLNILEHMPGVEVVQDPSVAVMLNHARNSRHELIEIDGYRVQIFSSNQQQTAKAQALNLESSLRPTLNHSLYVQYQTPFWKVRIGDFRTVDEAKEYKKEFVQQHPEMIGDTYIVRDKIKVEQ